ncbi:iron ABC transporter substrate-binding protein [Dactylosporangium sucinum]|uniref:Iron ABC transporter substrate-binding protein n=1 Tax=Dactylosporangium sucinum TaxID=1424081 RepID=A0A917TKT1_9ACTN|nr:iron ABC transporter substrate-binding protein [Dactylosporangium sucinum]GGM26146.1 iron ABC transporter substrate-binding protein [Dactylosporangium sucinum]
MLINRVGVRRRLLPVLAVPVVLTLLAACGDGAPEPAGASSSPGAALDRNVTLMLYNAQHDTVAKAWVDAFTAKTGIKVQIRQGSDLEIANQLVAEGAGSPADVFLTENSPAMSLVENAGLFVPIDPATLAQVPAEYAPSTGKWVGIAARSTVLAYNPEKISEADLPKSIMDLQDPKWKDRYGAAPKGADFQAIVSAMLELKGEAATSAWLAALKANGQAFTGNSAAMKAVNAGTATTAIIYHYYWYGDQAKTKENSKNVKLQYFGNGDPGAFVSISGGGVLKSSKHQAEAQALVNFITSKEAQTALAAGTSFEYSVGKDVASNAALKPLTELNAPKVDPSKLNSKKVVDLMTTAGLI